MSGVVSVSVSHRTVLPGAWRSPYCPVCELLVGGTGIKGQVIDCISFTWTPSYQFRSGIVNPKRRAESGNFFFLSRHCVLCYRSRGPAAPWTRSR